MDESLKLYEQAYDLMFSKDPILLQKARSFYQVAIGKRVSDEMTEEQRRDRAVRGGYAKAAKRLGVTVEEYLQRKQENETKSS